MSRSTGSSTPYVRLNLNEDEWPDNYWDQASQCSSCGINWPRTHLFEPTPCCQVTVVKVLNSPDMRWPDAIKQLKESRFERFYEEWNEGKSDTELVQEELKTDGVVDESKLTAMVEKFVEDASKDRSS